MILRKAICRGLLLILILEEAPCESGCNLLADFMFANGGAMRNGSAESADVICNVDLYFMTLSVLRTNVVA
jgi:hypothetical protein